MFIFSPLFYQLAHIPGVVTSAELLLLPFCVRGGRIPALGGLVQWPPALLSKHRAAILKVKAQPKVPLLQQECLAWREARGRSFCKDSICKTGFLKACVRLFCTSWLDHRHGTTPHCRTARKHFFRQSLNADVFLSPRERFILSSHSSSSPLMAVFSSSTMVLSCNQTKQHIPSFCPTFTCCSPLLSAFINL